MSDSKHIANFVNDLLKIKADLTLQAIPSNEEHEFKIKMAADSAKLILSTSRIGSLADARGQMLVRVFKDENDHCFRLYFLDASKTSTAFSLIIIQGTPHFFLVDADGSTVIPFVTDIDPLKATILFSFPEEVVTIETMPKAGEPITIGQLELMIDEEYSELRVQIADYQIRKNPPTKLILNSRVHGDKRLWLVPIRNGLATVMVGSDINNSARLTLCTFT